MLPFVTTQIDLQGIILSEIGQRKTNMSFTCHLYVKSKKTKKKYNHKYNRTLDTLERGVGYR